METGRDMKSGRVKGGLYDTHGGGKAQRDWYNDGEVRSRRVGGCELQIMNIV